jgi:hydroxypyruvate reductase
MADLKHVARGILQDTLAAINIPETMRRKMQREGSRVSCGDAAADLRDFRAVKVVAIGKASHAMVEGLASVLAPDFPFEGIVSAPVAAKNALAGMRYFMGGHPVPNEASLAAAEAILQLLAGCGKETLVIFLLSGGGSALAEKLLVPGAALEDVQGLHRALVTCGAPIDAINAVRKHLSAVKGGRLAAAAPRAMKLTYAVSDVPAGRESALASGPTIPDPTTRAEAEHVMAEYALREKLPERIGEWLVRNQMAETPKAGDAAFARSHFHLLLGVDDLFHPAHIAAAGAGFMPQCDNSTDDWPVRRAAEYLLGELEKLQATNPERRVAIIADGEVSSPVAGNGVGGRNAAFVLACVEKIAGKKIAVLSAGTDGIDGNSPAAGAVADGDTLARAREAGMVPGAFFQQSDAYTFFSRLGDAIMTGPTGNNLRDLRILMAGT